ncbi:MAG TPA: GMC family oxidoreductase [Leadbetterella sp.]|nr:GMC family oxidoreductase [Leadbetterella sp.]
MADENIVYDALVVGSGISGGYAAMELTKKGMKVLMIERGRTVEHIKDYTTATTPIWDMPHRGRASLELLKDYPKTARVYNKINEYSAHFYTKDALHPYQEDKRFDWIRGYQLGGKSITWGRIALRMSDLDFEANAKEGIAIDWPIRYKDLAPWYDYVEKFVGVSGNVDKIPHLPDGVFQPPMAFSCVEKDFLDKNLSNKFGARVIHARQAHLTQPTEEQQALGRASCQYRNMCGKGCPFGAYFSTQAATLPAAKKTGNLSIMTHAIVKEIIYDDTKQKAVGLLLVDTITKKENEVFGKTIFLNASALASTQILLNSKSKRFPKGMGNDSGVLGHYLMDHHFGAGASAEVEGFEDRIEFGRRPNGFYIPRYRNIGTDKRDYLRGFGYEGESKRIRPDLKDEFGEDFKRKYTEFGPWKIELSAFAETLPYQDNKIYLSNTEKDEWGIPLLVMSADYKENETKMRVDMKNDAAEMFDAVGYKNIKPYDEIRGFGRCIHEMGTARMGSSPEESVLNKNNQVWGVPNVFVTDGACMTSSSAVNPSLTYMALAARAADFAVSEMKKQNI